MNRSADSLTSNICIICGQITRDQSEWENHMLSHSIDMKTLESVKCMS